MSNNKKTPGTSVGKSGVATRAISKIGKSIVGESPESFGKELDSGTSSRQSPLEQEMGTSKYRGMIHTHNTKNKHILDRLPFTFPRKKIVRSSLEGRVTVECVECGYKHLGSEHTYMLACPSCKKNTRVFNPEAEKRGEDSEFKPGFLATAEDIIRMRAEREVLYVEKNGQ